MMARVVALLVLYCLTSPAIAEDAPEHEMTTFQLVFLADNPDFSEEIGVSESLANHRTERVQTAGNLYLRNLVKAEVALIAGPVPESDDFRQVAVLGVETRRDAEKMFEHSPQIETGRIRLEIYTWWAAKGILRKPKDLEATTTAYLGLLRRPVGAPSYPEEKLQEIQAGHLAHLGSMADSGDLVIAGPIEDGADLRGILIFRSDDRAHIEELATQDPAIQAGRLKLELHRWIVPEGSFPGP